MLRVHERERYRKMAAQAFGLAKGKALEITVREQSGFLTRFAANEIHQNGFREFLKISLRMIEKGNSARVETSDLSRASLLSCVGQLKALLKSRRESDHEPSHLSKQSYREVHDFDPRIAAANPDAAARDLTAVVRGLEKTGAEISGYDSAVCRHVYLANSSGLEAWHRSSAFRFGITARKGQGVGYASGFSAFQKEIRKPEIFKIALQRAGLAARPVRVKPGRYAVIFSPRAMAELCAPVFEDMNARKAADQNSFFSGRKGKRVFSKHLTVEDNVYYPGQSGLPFDGAGLPRKKVLLIDRGTVLNFVNDRKAALDLRQAPTGHGGGALQPSTMPVNVVVRNGKLRLDEFVARFDRAIFIPHIWYHQITNANTLMATGLIKGSALVWKNGAWQGGAQHLRYGQSAAEILRSVVDVSSDTETIKDKENGASLWPYTAVEGFRIV